jgi:hypothetical protein
MMTTYKIATREIVGKLLNHSEDDNITHVYDRYEYDQEKREALDTWAKRLNVIVSGLRAVAAD